MLYNEIVSLIFRMNREAKNSSSCPETDTEVDVVLTGKIPTRSREKDNLSEDVIFAANRSDSDEDVRLTLTQGVTLPSALDDLRGRAEMITFGRGTKNPVDNRLNIESYQDEEKILIKTARNDSTQWLDKVGDMYPFIIKSYLSSCFIILQK